MPPVVYYDERLQYFNDATVVEKLLELLHEADLPGEFRFDKAAGSRFVVNRYRRPMTNLFTTMKYETDPRGFMSYLAMIRIIIWWKVTKKGIYNRNLFYLMRTQEGKHQAMFKKLFLTLRCLPSCLVVAESRGYALGPFQTTYTDIITEQRVQVDFTNLTDLPNINWHRPDVEIAITDRVRAVVILEQKQAALLFSGYKNMIVVSTQGMTDAGTRLLIGKLVSKLPGIPFYGCFDFDVSGFQIFESLKYGSMESAWQAPPVPLLRNIIYPSIIQFARRDLRAVGAFRREDVDAQRLQKMRERAWIHSEPRIEESLILIGEWGTVSTSFLMAYLPDFFKRVVGN